ncbi:hypothetical protein BHM03_00020280 [Ensete ventricosum]|nr:hypothetical protein BHM03_00020280 [Ensete ventricosum]
MGPAGCALSSIESRRFETTCSLPTLHDSLGGSHPRRHRLAHRRRPLQPVCLRLWRSSPAALVAHCPLLSYGINVPPHLSVLCSSVFLRSLCVVMITSFLVLFVFNLVLWLVLRPNLPVIIVSWVVVSGFNLTVVTQQLSADFNLSLTFHNLNDYGRVPELEIQLDGFPRWGGRLNDADVGAGRRGSAGAMDDSNCDDDKGDRSGCRRYFFSSPREEDEGEEPLTRRDCNSRNCIAYFTKGR